MIYVIVILAIVTITNRVALRRLRRDMQQMQAHMTCVPEKCPWWQTFRAPTARCPQRAR